MSEELRIQYQSEKTDLIIKLIKEELLPKQDSDSDILNISRKSARQTILNLFGNANRQQVSTILDGMSAEGEPQKQEDGEYYQYTLTGEGSVKIIMTGTKEMIELAMDVIPEKLFLDLRKLELFAGESGRKLYESLEERGEKVEVKSHLITVNPVNPGNKQKDLVITIGDTLFSIEQTFEGDFFVLTENVKLFESDDFDKIIEFLQDSKIRNEKPLIKEQIKTLEEFKELRYSKIIYLGILDDNGEEIADGELSFYQDDGDPLIVYMENPQEYRFLKDFPDNYSIKCYII